MNEAVLTCPTIYVVCKKRRTNIKIFQLKIAFLQLKKINGSFDLSNGMLCADYIKGKTFAKTMN